MTPLQISEAKTCLASCNSLIAAGENEARLRATFTSHLRGMAGTNTPWWVEEHIKKTEAATRSIKSGRLVVGFVDNLVGLTAIEYEKNLTSKSLFAHGFDQIGDYLAGLLNDGAPVDNVIGILSDSVRWFSYKVDSINPVAVIGHYGRGDINLRQREFIDCSSADDVAARKLLDFLERNLGRKGGQQLTAETLNTYLGIESADGKAFVYQTTLFVDAAFAANPSYANLIQTLWADFVSFIGDSATARTFNKDDYVGELYILTLAKLIAANIVTESALVSNNAELISILDGTFFLNRGIENFVEYDYFGWLNKPPHISGLVGIASSIQQKLQTYEFRFLKPEDIFGPLLAQLAKSNQRILLGQEWTPAWLAEKIVTELVVSFPQGKPWRLVDICCGSGTFIVEVISRRIKTLPSGLPKEEQIRELCQAIYGFDIDPLAVLLAKIAWLIAVRPARIPFNGTYKVSLPVYHADSLFAISPLSNNVEEHIASGVFRLKIDTKDVDMPSFLAEPMRQPFFDAYIDGLYELALHVAPKSPPRATLLDVKALLKRCSTNTGIALSPTEQPSAETFGVNFAETVADLEKAGRNGLWAYMLKNTYRPALVRSRFNGLVTNFPWLALSKLSDNPYKGAVLKKATEFNIKAPGATFLHAELATVFLLHAVKHYLSDGAEVAAIVPNSVFQGKQHEPFRQALYCQANPPIDLCIQKIWNVDKSTFKTNVAAVLFGKKTKCASSTLMGASVSQTGSSSYPLHLSTLDEHTAWSEKPINRPGVGAYSFEEGVDIFPRTVWFHDITLTTGAGGRKVAKIAPICGSSSPFFYLVDAAKKCKTFRASSCTVDGEWIFPVLLSKHLAPFHIASPGLALLPLSKSPAGKWNPANSTSIALDRSAKRFFETAFSALKDVWKERPITASVVFDRINTKRGKLVEQSLPRKGYLVVFGAGGSIVCSAYAGLSTLHPEKLIIDQTLYWQVVSSKEEAVFLVGLLNSNALNELIQPFQPQGLMNERHIHTLAQAALPKWSQTDKKHTEVVVQTDRLISELTSVIASDLKLRKMLSPSEPLIARRTAIRDAIAQLPTYPAYEQACNAALV